MNIYMILVIQLMALGLCIGIKVYTKHLLDNVDGVRGVSKARDIEAAKQRQ